MGYRQHVAQGLQLIEAWGFKYKCAGFYWAKTNKTADPERLNAQSFSTGMGFWTRANPEMCLLATRGNPKRVGKDVRRLLISPRREHSRKPDEIYSRIERLVQGPYVELFARASRPGWDTWGDQRTLFDGGPTRTRRQPSSLSESVPVAPSIEFYE